MNIQGVITYPGFVGRNMVVSEGLQTVAGALSYNDNAYLSGVLLLDADQVGQLPENPVFKSDDVSTMSVSRLMESGDPVAWFTVYTKDPGGEPGSVVINTSSIPGQVVQVLQCTCRIPSAYITKEGYVWGFIFLMNGVRNVAYTTPTPSFTGDEKVFAYRKVTDTPLVIAPGVDCTFTWTFTITN